jgi:APA family basic amino acid/polyamine antiporter
MAMEKLPRTLGLKDLVLLIVGAVIGSGIFLVPGTVLGQVSGFIGPALLVWLLGGILSLLGALTYGELSAANPKAGGLYVYIRDCFGPLPAFLYGWSLFFAISGGTLATLAVAFSVNIAQVLPISPLAGKALSIGMIGLVSWINVRGTRQSANIQNWASGIKVAAIVLTSVALLILGRGFSGAGSSLWPKTMDSSLASGFGLAMVAVLWAYEGWQYATFSAGETVNAQRTFPRAFLIGSASLIGIYLLANMGYLAAIGPAQVAASGSPAAASVSAVFSPGAAKLVALTIALSIFSASNGNVLTAPRVYYAMAEDGLFFRRLAQVHPRYKTPAAAVILGSAWAAVLAATGSFQQLLTYVVFTGWIFYALGAACIFVYRRRVAAAERPYSVPGYPWTPLLFILSAAAIVLNTLVAAPRTAVTGLVIVLLGVPIYFIWRAVLNRRIGPAEPAEASPISSETE